LQAFRQAPKGLLEVGRTYGFSRRQSVTSIVLPAAIPTLFTGFRLGFTKAWLSLVVVELVASSEGLGYLIVYGRQLFQLDLVMAAVVIVGALGLLIDRSFDYAQKRLDHSRPTVGGRQS
jgi:sulfonate transport system permease protein